MRWWLWLMMSMLWAVPTLAAGPRPLAAYARPAGAQPASQAFTGRLRFDPAPADVQIAVVLDQFKIVAPDRPDLRDLPAFDLVFAQVGDRIAPARRGPIAAKDSFWDWAVEPGYVWEEPGRPGVSRATLPIALMLSGENCTHNGILTFLYSGTGAVSEAELQISRETCPYFRVDLFARFAVRLDAGTTSEAEAAGKAFAAELAARMPTRPIAAIATRYPGIDAADFGAPADLRPADLTLFGVIADGVHYAGPCHSRQGDAPFCEETLFPSFSVAKSVAASFGMMRLDMLRPGASASPIGPLVPECAKAGGWDRISIADALDMSTGRYVSADMLVDDETEISEAFHNATTHAIMAPFGCTAYPVKEAPGRTWVYHTSDTYLAGLAMSEYWRRATGRPQADFFDEVLGSDLYPRLGLSPAVSATRRTRDAQRNPFFGSGLSFIPDDFAKIGQFLIRGGKAPDGTQLIAASDIAAVLQRDPADTGLQFAPGERYHDGFWAKDVGALIGCSAPVWIAYMSGYGGVTLAIAPNDIVYYYVSDGDQHAAWDRAIRAIDRIRPMCPAR